MDISRLESLTDIAQELISGLPKRPIGSANFDGVIVPLYAYYDRRSSICFTEVIISLEDSSYIALKRADGKFLPESLRAERRGILFPSELIAPESLRV